MQTYSSSSTRVWVVKVGTDVLVVSWVAEEDNGSD
jgi:hypothetical protein